MHRPCRRGAGAVLPDAGRSDGRTIGHDHRRIGSGAEDRMRCKAAFIEHDGFQCGYCTPGQICAAAAMLRESRSAACRATSRPILTAPVRLSREEVRERMSGNLCRCGAHNGIVDAILQVAAERGMNPVSYHRASSIDQAIQMAAGGRGRLLGGGTNLVDLMRKGVERPSVWWT